MDNLSQNGLPAIIDSENGFDFKKVLYSFLGHWQWFVISVIITVLLAFIFLRYTTPVYNINSKILITEDKGSSSSSPQDLLSALNLFNPQNNVDNEKEVLQTHFIVQKVVDALQLNVRYFSVGNIKSTELYVSRPFTIKLLYLRDSIKAQQFNIKFSKDGLGYVIKQNKFSRKYGLNDTVKNNDLAFIVLPNNIKNHANDDYEIKINTPDATTESYLKALTFNISDKQASVIQITLQETVPKKGEDVLNKLYEVYTEVNKDDKDKTADSTISFINNRLSIVSSELTNADKNVEQFKIANKLSTDIQDQSKLVLNNANNIQQQLTNQDVQLSVVQSIEDHLNNDEGKIVPNAGVIQDPTYISTVQEFNALVLERDRQLQTTKADNPLIKSLNNQIEGLKQNLLISLKNIKRQMQISRDELQRKNDLVLGQLNSGPTIERAYLDISRQQDVKQQLYLFLLQKREETSISKSGTLSNSRLIEPAKSETLPYSPNKPLIYLAAFFAGIILPAGFLYFKNLMNNTVEGGEDITKATNAPVIGEVGHNKTNKTVVVEQNSRTPLAEQFRAIRTNLQFLLKGKEQQIIMITSSSSGEGKSFLTINLGSALAISNKKTVIVELDLRKPKISKELGISNERGFTDYMISKLTKEEIIKQTQVHPNLFLVSSGTIPPNPAELLLSKEILPLFEWLKTKFDYIILDTPPAGVVIDAVLIGKHADASIYVVRQGYTLKDQLKLIDNFKKNEKIPNVSVLLNDVRLDDRYGYKYGYSYGYSYGYYSDYYLDDKPKKKFFKRNNKA